MIDSASALSNESPRLPTDARCQRRPGARCSASTGTACHGRCDAPGPRRRATPVVDRLLERVEDKCGDQGGRDAPPDDPPGEDVDDERHVDEAAPGRDVGKVGDPELIGSGGDKPAIDEIGRPVGRGVRAGGHDPRAPAGRAPQPHVAHQALDRAARHAMPLASQLLPDFPRPVDVLVVIPHALNRRAELVVTPQPGRPTGRIHPPRTLPKVGRRGDRHDGTDRLDPVLVSMVIDETDHHFTRRSSSASKYAEAFRRISFARFSSRTSRSRSFNRWRSSLVRPLRWPVSRSACRTHRRGSGRASQLARDRCDRRPLRGMLGPVLPDHPHGSLWYLRGIPTWSCHSLKLEAIPSEESPDCETEIRLSTNLDCPRKSFNSCQFSNQTILGGIGSADAVLAGHRHNRGDIPESPQRLLAQSSSTRFATEGRLFESRFPRFTAVLADASDM